MEKFPVPVTGEKIPRGWFARLVFFMNSLVLRGDNQYTLVKRTDSGTTVTLTPSLINSIKAAAPAAGGGSGASGLAASVSGGTATVSVSGTSPLQIVQGANVQVTDDAQGRIHLAANALSTLPDYGNAVGSIGASPSDPDASASFNQTTWIVGTYGLNGGDHAVFSIVFGDPNPASSGYAYRHWTWSMTIPDNQGVTAFPISFVLPAGVPIQVTASDYGYLNAFAYATLP